MHTHPTSNAPVVVLLALAAIGCGGPATPAELPGQRASYNEALVRSSNEQLLLNVVRLRYLHAPQFMEVTAVNSQSAFAQSSNAGLTGNFGNNLLGTTQRPDFASPSIGGSVSMSQRPTVSYAPLSGEAFTQRMVHPISPRTIFSLVNVGWRIDRLFACCVARVNDAAAPVIASADPHYGGERFRRISEVLYALQERGALTLDEVRVGDGRALELSFGGAAGHEAELVSEARELLGLSADVERYRVLPGHPPDYAGGGDGRDYLVVRGRSLLGALFYLSHGVQVGAGEGSARSLDFADPNGQAVHVANPVPGALLAVHACDDEPVGAYVRTHYRDRWFAVRDADLGSKQILLLLQVLFSTLSTSDDGGPTLTLPVGR